MSIIVIINQIKKKKKKFIYWKNIFHKVKTLPCLDLNPSVISTEPPLGKKSVERLSFKKYNELVKIFGEGKQKK